MKKSDLRQLRNAFGTFLTGVTVVTSRESSGIPRGFTANSFTSVSLDPPMLLICVDKSADGFDVFTQQPGFSINILTEDQVEISGLFASKRSDKFDLVEWTESESGYPLLTGGCAWFDCKRHKTIDAGDHVIIIGEVLSYDYNDKIGLGYVRGGYMSLSLERLAAKAAGSDGKIVVGAIVENAGKILLLQDDKTGEPQVPASGLNDSAGSLAKLTTYFANMAFEVTVSSLFAVFENAESGQQSIYYRATADCGDMSGFTAFADIPWSRITTPGITTMLQRYVAESTRGRFGVYFGSDKNGAVKTLIE